ncbi:hypothetical protein Q4489_10050 [Thalassotalea sp. 1_MG-2023]|uniref:tetratricopeptide repeat protein n=1 Tax=Thalassotalea sp. 1_MG-2023 TaxID=3062680 RepID=UPI0026E37256|nr:hypothetical protein [Thalassotalea sp. 1_MG-2023]MDO6427357.1 hypothetical protein [Thalassotalea sp. 1_MG-2023]
MRLKSLIISVCAVLLLAIPLLLPAITNVALQRDIAPSWLQNYGAYKELPTYYHFLRRNHKVGSEKWLRASIEISTDAPKVSYEIAEYYRHLGRENQALFWLKKSAQQGDKQAVSRLAKSYIIEKKIAEADRLLSSYTEHRDILKLSIETALMLGNENKYQERTKLLAIIDNRDPLFTTLANFSIFEQLKPLNRQCEKTIQPIATELGDLILLQHRIRELSAFPINDYICFEKPLYQPLKALACFHQNTDRIQCKVNIWKSYQLTHVDYLLIMHPEGGANVDHGIIYIDRHDTIDVLVHELMHSFGFIDEYPLPLNHQRCSTAQAKPFAHNVVVLKNEVLHGDRKVLRAKVLEQLPWRDHILPTTPVLTATENGWQLGTSDSSNNLVGLYRSRTCQGNRTSNNIAIKLQAFKPIPSKTKLEYFELKVPTLYWQLLKQQPKRFMMPDHRVNAQRLH